MINAIKMKEQEIIIWGEVEGKKLNTITENLLGLALKLTAETGGKVNLIIPSESYNTCKDEIESSGADRIIKVDLPLKYYPNPEITSMVVNEIIKELQPSLVLFGSNDTGRDVAPRAGAMCGATVVCDCTSIEFDRSGESILIKKPVYGTRAISTWKSNRKIVVATFKGAFEKKSFVEQKKIPEIKEVKFTINFEDIKVKLTETIREKSQPAKLEEAKVIVSGGGGIGGSEGFKQLAELASILGGAVGATRVPVDEGWVPKSMEIGLTGKTVNPDIYIAVGISGAPQHMAGCSGAKTIIAINKDPHAPIFKQSDIGIVADYKKVIPLLINSIKGIISPK